MPAVRHAEMIRTLSYAAIRRCRAMLLLRYFAMLLRRCQFRQRRFDAAAAMRADAGAPRHDAADDDAAAATLMITRCRRSATQRCRELLHAARRRR